MEALQKLGSRVLIFVLFLHEFHVEERRVIGCDDLLISLSESFSEADALTSKEGCPTASLAPLAVRSFAERIIGVKSFGDKLIRPLPFILVVV